MQDQSGETKRYPPTPAAQRSCWQRRGQAAKSVDARRRFLEQATTFVLGTVSLTVLPSMMGQFGDDTDESASDDADGKQSIEGDRKSGPPANSTPVFGFLVDIEKCIGSGKCLTACRVENNVPDGYARTWVERYIVFADGSVQVDLVPEKGYAESDIPSIGRDQVERAFFVPKLCNHCRDAPCNQVCPTHASVTSPEGVELVDPQLCIGCAYCVQACPYGARFINPDTGVADKCTWCYHRLVRNKLPACVEACPTGARIFGRLDDPSSDIRRRLAKVPKGVLKEHLGTHPKLYYLGLSDEVT